MKSRILVVLLLIGFWQTSPAWALNPTDLLKNTIEKSLQILKDPQYQGAENKTEQRHKFWALIRQMFDFTEVSKRAVARNWRRFSAAEKNEFMAVFSELLGHTYVDKIQKGFRDDRVVIDGSETMKKSRTLVHTRIVGENLEIPIDYKLLLKSGEWKVYDVSVEGVSLIKNYRTQFNKILMKKKPGDLIQRLREKLEQIKKKKAE